MKYFVLIALLISATASAKEGADWRSNSNTDDFTGQTEVEAFGLGPPGKGRTHYTQLGFSCLINDGTKEFLITFDAAEIFAAKGREVLFLVKVDDNTVNSFDAFTYTNSGRRGFTRISVRHPIVTELMAGNFAKVRLTNKYRSEYVDFVIDLWGSSAQITKAVNACK